MERSHVLLDAVIERMSSDVRSSERGSLSYYIGGKTSQARLEPVMHSAFPNRFTKQSPIGASEDGIAFIWENTATTATKALRERAAVYNHLLGASILEDKCDLVRFSSCSLRGPSPSLTLSPNRAPAKNLSPIPDPPGCRLGFSNESPKPSEVWSGCCRPI